jgi:hypothetical protein
MLRRSFIWLFVLTAASAISAVSVALLEGGLLSALRSFSLSKNWLRPWGNFLKRRTHSVHRARAKRQARRSITSNQKHQAPILGKANVIHWLNDGVYKARLPKLKSFGEISTEQASATSSANSCAATKTRAQSTMRFEARREGIIRETLALIELKDLGPASIDSALAILKPALTAKHMRCNKRFFHLYSRLFTIRNQAEKPEVNRSNLLKDFGLKSSNGIDWLLDKENFAKYQSKIISVKLCQKLRSRAEAARVKVADGGDSSSGKDTRQPGKIRSNRMTPPKSKNFDRRVCLPCESDSKLKSPDSFRPARNARLLPPRAD